MFLLSLKHSYLSSLQALANAMPLCGMGTVFPVIIKNKKTEKKTPKPKSFSYPSRPSSNVSSSVRISTPTPAKNASVPPSPALGHPYHYFSASPRLTAPPCAPCSLLALLSMPVPRGADPQREPDASPHQLCISR